MKRIYLIMLMIAAMMVSCNPKDEDDNNNSGGNGNNGGGNDQYNGYEYVNLGLPSGLKWATCNVGAENPEDYGDYYAWGETETKSYYDEYNCSTLGEGMNDISGKAQYDVARKKWGGTWRMPTRYEMEELVEECEWECIEAEVNGISGCRVTGPNGNHIFLPAAGNRYGASLSFDGEYGYYWSSSPDDGDDGIAYRLHFSSVEEIVVLLYRSYGLTVRPVSE